MKLLLDRGEYGDNSTCGDLYVNGDWECATLERAIPVNEIKVPGETCIPPGIYQVLITWSPKFQRDLPLLVGVPDFDAIRIHPGNTSIDTKGCVVVGEKFADFAGIPMDPFLLRSSAAFDRLFKKLFDAKRNGEDISIEVAP